MRDPEQSAVIPAVLRGERSAAGIGNTGYAHGRGMTIFCLAALLAAAPLSARAQTTGSEQPIEITASKSVEWLRGQNQYVARENVVVTQGGMTIHADLLTADYREGATSSTEIWQITAEGNVRIKDETNTAYGDKGVYDVTNGIAVLTGRDLKLVSPEQTVTARDRMEYHSNARMAKAVGNAKVVRPEDTLTASVITAYFKDDSAAPATTPAQKTGNPAAGGSLDRLEAEGNVVIVTPTETLRGSKAVYRATSNTAEITGNVKIERGPNIMEGTRAEVDLNTNISKMFGSAGEGGRVRGVFFPSSNKDKSSENPLSGQSVNPPSAPVPPADGADSSGAAPLPAAKVGTGAQE